VNVKDGVGQSAIFIKFGTGTKLCVGFLTNEPCTMHTHLNLYNYLFIQHNIQREIKAIITRNIQQWSNHKKMYNVNVITRDHGF
jgi:hypothetical protein